MKIDQQSLEDLLAVYRSLTPTAVAEAIERLMEILPLLERADMPAGEQAAVDALTQKTGAKSFEPILLRQTVRELCHYRPDLRAAILNAALALAKPRRSASSTLERIRPAVLQAFRNLDAGTKAILIILEELRRVDGEINTDYNMIPDELGEADVDILRREPGLTPILHAYDLAREILDAEPGRGAER